MLEEKKLTEQESLQLITNMIRKVRGGYHENGIGALLWGTVVTIASFVSYLQIEFDFNLPFDIWLIVLFSIIPQVLLINKDIKLQKVKMHEDTALYAVWLVYALTIFGFSFFQNVVPDAADRVMHANGWQLIKQQIDHSKPDQIIKPFFASFYSIYILIYALPTLVTGIVKKYRPMIVGACISYMLFIISCYTETKYDFLLGALAAFFCWFIPGILLRRNYLQQKRANV